MITHFKDWPIGVKLSVGFGVVLVLLALVGISTLYSTGKIQERSRSVEAKDFSEVNLSIGMKETILKLEAFFAEVWAREDPLILEDIDIQREKFTILFSEFKEAARGDPLVNRELALLEHDFARYYSLGDKTTRLFLEGKRAEAVKLLESFRRLAFDMRRRIDIIQNENIARLSQSLGSIDTMARRTQRANILLLAAAMIFGFMITVVLTRSIVSSVMNLLEGTRKIYDGDLSHRVVARSRDEIGHLASSFNWMTEHLQSTMFSKGQLEQIIATRTEELRRARDELERRVLERTRELQEAKEYAELLLEVVPSGVFTLDRERHITSWNRKAEEVTGFSAEEVVGKRCLFIEKLPCEKECAFEHIDSSVSVIAKECVITRKDGKQRIISKNFDFLKDNRGNILGSIESFEDITERKKAGERIREAAEEWRVTFDSITDLISIHDKDFRIIRINKAFADFYKVDPQDLLGVKCYRLVRGLDHPHPFCPHQKVLETRQPSSSEIFEPITNLYFEVTTSPIFDEKGEVAGSVHVAKDITERKKTEKEIAKTNERLLRINDELKSKTEELKKANAELEEMYKIKSEFTSMVSHELRTPLTAIKEGIDLIFDKSLGPINTEQHDFLALAKRNVDRLTRLINDVLDFSKLTAKKMQLRKEECTLNDILTSAAESFRPAAKKKGLTLHVDVGQSEGVVMHLDQDRVSQIITNLLDNALKFTNEGSVSVLTGKDDRHNLVTICIKDTGMGIKEEDIPKLFQPFSQLGGTHGRKTGGTGLGLAITRDLVEHCGGKIWVNSVYGEGSAFCLSLPLRERRRKS